MKLVIGTFLTLDGVMQAPGGPEEDKSEAFPHGGWAFPHFDDVAGKVMDDWIGRADALLLGRKTYEIFAAHWPRVPDTEPIAARFNRIPKYVASRTLERLSWQPATLLEGNVVEEVKRLKARPGGELQVHGSGDLIQTLLEHHLIDQFRIWHFPLLLGTGKRLFGRGTLPTGLKLVETLTTGTGAVLSVLEPAGKVTYGSFALE